MSDTSELMNNLESAIYDALAATSGVTDVVGTNIVRGLAQMYSGHPIVIIEFIVGGFENDNPVSRANLLYLIRCITEDGAAAAASCAGAIHDALDRAELSVSGWKNIVTRVEDFFSLNEFIIQPAYETYHNGRYIRFVLTKT